MNNRNIAKYCLVNRETRSVNYGIGIYSELVINLVKSIGSIEIVILHLYKDIDKPRTHFSQGIRHIYISLQTDELNDEVKTMLDLEFSQTNVLFHFNHLIVDQWSPVLKKMYPNAKIACTVHFLSWYFSLMGNKDLFYKVIKTKGDINLHPNSEYTYRYYLKNKDNFKCCDYIITLCKETFEMLRDVYHIDPSNMQIIPNGIKPLEYPVSRSYQNSTINIIYVGRIDEIKGIKYLVKAFKSINNKYKNTRLHLIGDADDPTYLDQCLSICPDILYHGRLSHNELDVYYRQSDIGVLASFHEQCSYTLLEMMAYGLPIVGSNATGTNEMLSSTPSSIVPIELCFKDEDQYVQKLTTAMERYICSAELRKNDSRQLYSSFCEKYTLDVFNEKMSRFLNYILQQ